MFVQRCIYFSRPYSHVQSWVCESHCVFVLYSQSFYSVEFVILTVALKNLAIFEIHTYKKSMRKRSIQLEHWSSINAACKCTWVSNLLFILTVCRPWCSAGQSVRTRRILQEAHDEGRPCPNQLTQTKPCPIRPCYTWLLSDWFPCTVEVWPALWMLDWRVQFSTSMWCYHVLTKSTHLHHD